MQTSILILIKFVCILKSPADSEHEHAKLLITSCIIMHLLSTTFYSSIYKHTHFIILLNIIRSSIYYFQFCLESLTILLFDVQTCEIQTLHGACPQLLRLFFVLINGTGLPVAVFRRHALIWAPSSPLLPYIP